MALSPICTVQDGGGAAAVPTNGATVTAGNVITIALQSTAGVGVWSISQVGRDDLVASPTLTVNNNNKTATFTAPTAPWALIFQSVVGVNSLGLDANGLTQSSYTTTFGIYTLAGSNRLFATNERSEGNASFGWITKINAFLRSGGTFTAGGDLTGTSASQQVVSITGSAGAVGIGTGITFQWAQTGTGGLKILARTTDAATNAFTLQGQYAFALATGTNRQAGNVVVDLGVPTNGLIGASSEASFAITRNGSRMANIGLANNASYNCLWLGGDPNAANSSNTAAVTSDGASFTYLVGPAGAAAGFSISGSTQLYCTTTAVRLFGNGVTGLGGGNGIVNLATCVTEPTSAPTGGALWWQDTTRGLHFANPSTQFVDWMIAPTFTGSANTQQNKFWQYGANVRTTNATTTTILTIPLATPNTNGCIQVTVTGRDQASGTVVDGVSFSQLVQFKNVIGTVTAAATQAGQLKSNDTSMAACTLTYAISLTNVLVQVTGLAGVTIDWAATANVIIN